MARIEKDSLGSKKLPDDVYYGIQTLRAVENFPVSGIKEQPIFIRAYFLLKKAAALANMELSVLDGERGSAIVKVINEALSDSNFDKFEGQFIVDVFQAGAGTSFNMNVNEVIANMSLELLGREKGDYDFLSPNDHVNMGQSTNDTFSTATHIAVIFASEPLLNSLNELAESFKQKGMEFLDIPKVGRTHLMDAIPLRLGDEFLAYSWAIKKAVRRIEQRRDDLLEVAIGSTATGTGANAHPMFRKRVIDHLVTITGLSLKPAEDSFETLQSRALLGSFSSSLKELALELIRISNDLRLLASGPTSGIAEIELPAIQPGSSIMPGKVNPVMAECLNMVCFQVLGNDTAISMAVQSGQLELNVMTPIMTYNLLESIRILTNFLPVFQQKCVDGIVANREKILSYLDINPLLATLLSPKIGYLKASEIAKEAQERQVSVKELVLEKGILSEKEADDLFDINKISKSLYRK